MVFSLVRSGCFIHSLNLWPAATDTGVLEGCLSLLAQGRDNNASYLCVICSQSSLSVLQEVVFLSRSYFIANFLLVVHCDHGDPRGFTSYLPSGNRPAAQYVSDSWVRFTFIWHFTVCNLQSAALGHWPHSDSAPKHLAGCCTLGRRPPSRIQIRGWTHIMMISFWAEVSRHRWWWQPAESMAKMFCFLRKSKCRRRATSSLLQRFALCLLTLSTKRWRSRVILILQTLEAAELSGVDITWCCWHDYWNNLISPEIRY